MSIILASQSPRRRELLAQMGVPQFEVVPALGEEIASPGLSPAQLVEVLSRQKAEEVAVQAGPDDVVIAADTVVAVDGAVLGKPRDPADAARMLSLLSGRAHTVYTGVTVRRGTFSRTAHEATQVRFRPLTQSEISAYIATGEPMDKAGAYGVQNGAAKFVAGIEGCYFNVMGFPVSRVYNALKELDVL